eukprot:CAMPEP_0183400504 /NCGR_PEP_ID=MMETSP0370-20130417/12638_1 /TAXON_ID=268820 /ORGANISM="Peridinium aciculiferum, Strain PAER-2" /LENGTH=74 /DNA_ID=CAMNT_0025581815 /DNA_START=54 /DNA_END=275 /DNA_ORIENTATION=+
MAPCPGHLAGLRGGSAHADLQRNSTGRQGPQARAQKQGEAQPSPEHRMSPSSMSTWLNRHMPADLGKATQLLSL